MSFAMHAPPIRAPFIGYASTSTRPELPRDQSWYVRAERDILRYMRNFRLLYFWLSPKAK